MTQDNNIQNLAGDTGGVEEMPHTADVALRVWGIDFNALLSWAARGLNKLMYDGVLHPPFDVQKRFTLDAFDQESLLVDWLSELAFWAESEQILFQRIDIQTLSDRQMKVVAEGRTVPALKTVVKAITYHNLTILRTNRGLETIIVLDV